MRVTLGRAAAVLGMVAALGLTARADVIKPGKVAPTWSGKTVAGKPISSSQYKGKVVLLNFFGYT
ncbi:MAG TPA: hypothetical protein VFU47_11510 [Armatimonadota bacterium]|nr:hypothetical protein [Armatimonadota bacterium]